MKRTLYLVTVLTILTTCSKDKWFGIDFYYTDDGGVRVKDPKVFEYNTPEFRTMDKSLIDTTSIYLLDSLYNPYAEKEEEKIKKLNGGSFLRFFATGQVLIIDCDSIPTSKIMNNENLGTPGYFIIDGNKLKMDIFQNLNGGQTGKYFGLIQNNGNIMMYEQRPETYRESFEDLEAEHGRKTTWKKLRVDSLEYYKPSW